MPAAFFIGIAATIAVVIVTIVVPLIFRGYSRGVRARQLSAEDRTDIDAAQRRYDIAVSSQMTGMNSAQRQQT